MTVGSRWLTSRIAALLALVLGATGPGCKPSPPPPPQHDAIVSIGTYNLGQYGWHDRDGDGQPKEFKPEAERFAVAEVIAAMDCDILAVQEIGQRPALDDLLALLRKRGRNYPHVEWVARTAQTELNLALLSRFPIIASRPRLLDTYTIGGTRQSVLRGFLDVELEVGARQPLRILVAHLKSRVFHPLGQTEMRRNEARLLAGHVRRALRESPDTWLLVVGDLNDTPGSAPIRLLLGDPPETLLLDLRPADGPAGVWTWGSRATDEYARLDYLLASPVLARRMVEAPCIVRDTPAEQASDHRPVVARFRLREAP